MERKSLFTNPIGDDLPNALSLDSKLHLREKYLISYWGSQPDNVPNTLKKYQIFRVSNIKIALRIIGTLPVTSCKCERSSSALRRLNTYTRSTVIAERLNDLALL